MSDREERRKRLARATGRRSTEDATPAGTTAVRSKPVRITVDLSPAQYRRVKAWTLQAGADIGASVSLADVIRTLAGYLEEDPTLAQRVTEDLQQQKGPQP